MKGVGLFENHEKSYILPVFLEPKILHVQSTLYYQGISEPSKRKEGTMLQRTLPYVRLHL